jgi:transposase
MTLSHLMDNTFVGIDVGGAGLDVAWHWGGGAHCANRPDAIATLVERLQSGPKLTRIVLEPTGGYEKSLVKALRQAQLPVEVIHTTRFRAYCQLVGVKAKSDTSGARLPASYAAAPDEIRGRKAGHVELPEDAIREELSELASRRDQLKHMIHAETCRLGTVRMAELRQAIMTHLEALRAEDKQVHQMMMALVRQRLDLKRSGPAQNHQGHRREVCPGPSGLRSRTRSGRQQGGISAHRGRSFGRQSGTMTAPSRIHGGRAAVRSILYMVAVTASRHNPVLRPFTNVSSPKANRPKSPSSPCSDASWSSPMPWGQCHLTANTVDPGRGRTKKGFFSAIARRLGGCRSSVKMAVFTPSP